MAKSKRDPNIERKLGRGSNKSGFMVLDSNPASKIVPVLYRGKSAASIQN